MRADQNENSVANFVQKTFEILSNYQYLKIIHWSGNGKEFTIKDIQQFEQKILPKYFRHKNINSFIRQLNMYGFHKSRKEPTKNIFSHQFFIKDRADLLQKVKRKIRMENIYVQNIDGIQEQKQAKIETQVTPRKSENIVSVASIPVYSSVVLEKQSDTLKNIISKSYIYDWNPQICLKMRQHYNQAYEDDNDDIISIANEIMEEREALQNRTQGISIVKTINFLDGLDL